MRVKISLSQGRSFGYLFAEGPPPDEWTFVRYEGGEGHLPKGAYLVTESTLVLSAHPEQENRWEVQAKYYGPWGEHVKHLPIPKFNHVRKVVEHEHSNVLICPDPMAGRKDRFTVIRLHRESWEAKVIGRELPLELAEQVAERDATFDGAPLKNDQADH